MLTRAPRAPRSAVERGQQLADAVWLGQEMRTLGQVFELRTLVTRGHHDARPWLLLQRFGRDGSIQDDSTREFLQTWMDTFIGWVSRFKG